MKPKSDSAKLNQEIDANLKRAFDDVLNEEVPDRFKDLLAKLKAGDGHGQTSGGQNGG